MLSYEKQLDLPGIYSGKVLRIVDSETKNSIDGLEIDFDMLRENIKELKIEDLDEEYGYGVVLNGSWVDEVIYHNNL